MCLSSKTGVNEMKLQQILICFPKKFLKVCVFDHFQKFGCLKKGGGGGLNGEVNGDSREYPINGMK